jgi:hypothetical protein
MVSILDARGGAPRKRRTTLPPVLAIEPILLSVVVSLNTLFQAKNSQFKAKYKVIFRPFFLYFKKLANWRPSHLSKITQRVIRSELKYLV